MSVCVYIVFTGVFDFAQNLRCVQCFETLSPDFKIRPKQMQKSVSFLWFFVILLLTLRYIDLLTSAPTSLLTRHR